MPKFLSQNQVNDFHEAGFLAPLDVMPEDQALSYRQRLEAAENEYPQELNAENRNNPHLRQQRRIGYALQAYMPPPARQVLGENYWLPVRGEEWHDDSKRLTRPKADMDAEGVANRKLVNDNWANILYQGAEQKRAY